MRGNHTASIALLCLVLLSSTVSVARGGSVAETQTSTSGLPNEQSHHLSGFFLVSKTTSPRKQQPFSRLALRKRSAPRVVADTSALLAVVDQPDIDPKHRAIATEALRQMPEHCLEALKNFYVRYDHPENRGLAGKSSIVVTGNVSDSEFRALVIHEFGHVMDLGCLQGNVTSGTSAFRDGAELMWNDDPSVAFYSISWLQEKKKRAGSSASDFVTGYAAADAFEDMAESIVYYVFEQDAFRVRAQGNAAIARKLHWIETILFPQGLSVAEGLHRWNGTVPWDATKLPYVWNMGTSIAQTR